MAERTQGISEMDPIRPAPGHAPKATLNDPTVVTPMPLKSLRLPVRPAGDATRTAALGGGAFGADAGAVPMPRVGDLVLGFRLVDKLGEGGFGSVYLAEQVGLAGRLVALKFTSRPTQEPERLAGLQHTNIVPVYSVHTVPPLQVICMPYLGRQTLHDVLRTVAETKMLPATGAGLLSTANALRPDTRKGTKSRWPATPKSRVSDAAGPESGRRAKPQPQPVRDLLERLSFPDSVVWLFTRLAEGLAHAHERGILHMDLKPGNVLVTDDGVPMLLDFGLAHDLRGGPSDQTGGTLRYMSPEQLEAYATRRPSAPDARMDLYSLGVMFHELLTGEHPYAASLKPGLPAKAMLAARRGAAPKLRTLNAKVAPAVEAVVAKLLHPDPERRYQTAAELLTDLTLHQEHRPLRHARNPSWVERARKYRRRHPVLAVLTLAAALGLSTFGAAGAAIQQARQRTGAEAALQAGRLGEELPGLRIDLTSQENPATRGGALAKAEAWFDRYGVTPDSRWRDEPQVRRLPDAERDRLADELGELALLGAHAERLNATGRNDADKAAAHRRALRWNRLAANCYEADAAPPAVREQRERLAAELGEPAPAGETDLARCRPEGSVDLYLRGLSHLADGRYRNSTEVLEGLVEKEPEHEGGQFALAVGYQYQGRHAEALERFQIAKALRPRDPRPALNRGLVLALANKNAEAAKEFTAAIQRDPRNATAHYHRSLAEARRGRLPEALADATKALELGESAYRTHLLRAKLHAAGGDAAAAERDFAAAAKIEPRDEADYLARGSSKLAKDPTGALADFAKAAELNPRYLAAWQNQAHVLSERLDQPEQALDRLDKAVELHAGYAPAVAGRAVVQARLGQRDEARKGADAALALSDDPVVRYQAACVYSLTSKAAPDDANTALGHLRAALRDGYANFANIAADPDLADLRSTAEFDAVVAAAKKLRAR